MKRKLHFLKLELIGILFLLISQQAKAIDEKYAAEPLRGSNNQIAKDSSTIVQDTVFYNLSLRPTQTTFKVKDCITFKLDEFANLAVPDTFKVTISFKVYFSKLVGSTVVLDSSALQTVYIEYNKFRNYQSKANYTFSGGYRSEVKIFSVTSESSSGTFSSYKDVLMLENQIVVTREYTFDPNTNAVQSVSGNLGVEDPNSCTSTGEYVANWGNVRAADEYDFEWTYIDSSTISNYYLSGTTIDPKKVFRNNATRVSIASESYVIPLLFDNHGHLYYRVRAVQVKRSGQRIASNWSSAYSGGLGHYEFMGHERSLNWQSDISFAEEGKRKAVVQYFDGTLRNRQTVTKDNTTCYTIVAESMYDFQGRPVIQVLPAPTLSKLLGYTAGFNKDTTGATYEKLLFDRDTTAGLNNCNAFIPGMDTSSGASKYYSPANPLVNNGFNKYIPDAKLYPFSETRFTPDNTGRIAMQGGVGKDFQVNYADGDGHTHETRYFYGGADQEELDALFGTEVGTASHYSKNMVKDANGQYSVSYVDMHGRTIATALSGKPESKMDSLVSGSTKNIVKKLLDPSNNLVSGTSIISSKNLLVTSSGNHRFQYSLLPESISIKTCDSINICYDCLYDLDITISNDCSNPGNIPITIHRTNLRITGILDTLCNENTPFPSVDTTIDLFVGSYTVTKKLSISEAGLAGYNAIFLRRNTCKSLQEFIDEQQHQFLTQVQCYPTCQTCVDSLGTWNNYRSRYMLNNSIPLSDTASFREEAWLSYNDQREACDALCNQTALHNSLHKQLVSDMTYPYGQYAIIDSTNDPHNIFYSVDNTTGNLHFKQLLQGATYKDEYGQADMIVVDNQGTKVPPTDPAVTREQFASNFKPSWAETLLPLHPEYNKLQRFESYAASHLWDERFARIETFAQAVDSGFLNPTNIPQGAGYLPANSMFNAPAYSSQDPFFTTLEPTLKSKFQDSLLHFVTQDTFDFSVWSLATIMAHCESGDAVCLNIYKAMNQAFSLDTDCSGELDFAWRYFRQMYLHKKQEFMDNIIFEAFGYPGLLDWQYENFSHMNLLDGSTEMGATTVAGGTDSLAKYINDNCHAYVSQWLEELHPCNLTASDADAITKRLIGVCNGGGDQGHIYGSSTTKPGTYSEYLGIYHDSSFIQVLKDYLGSRYDSTCNAFLITAPKAYDAQPPYSDIQVYNHPDSCQCSKISRFYQQFRASGDSSFSGYVSHMTGVDISEQTLDSLRMLCNGEISCRFLSAPLTLPTVLQCNVSNKCIGCIAMEAAYQQFRISFPGIIPSYNNSDSFQQKRNLLFEHFMNYRFGFAKSFVEYLDFMDTCQVKLIRQSTCDTLNDLLAAYQNTLNNHHMPQYDAGGCDTSKIKVYDYESELVPNLSDWMYNGVFKAPFGDTLDYPEFLYVDSLCIDTGIIVVNRMRSPESDSGYAHWLNAGNPSYSYGTAFQRLQFDNTKMYVSLVNGKFAKLESGAPLGLSDSIYANIEVAFAGGVSTYSKKYLSTGLKDIGEWVNVKTKIYNETLKFYLNDVLLDSTLLNNVPRTFFFLETGDGPDYQMDWLKMYDCKDRLRYFEDFNGCDKMAAQTLGQNCTKDCSSAFRDYFNDHMTSSYTNAELDSVYLVSCGFHPEPCYKNPIDCNHLKQAVVDYYSSLFKIKHDSTGLENTWNVGYSYVVRDMTQYSLKDFIRNGIISTPDSVTTLTGDFNFGYRIPMCLGNDFAWETRVRTKPGTDPEDIQYQSNFVFDNSARLIIEFTGNTNFDGFQVINITTDQGSQSFSDFSQPLMHDVTFNDWRILRFVWKNNKVYVYVDGVLCGSVFFPGNFNSLLSFNEGSWHNGPLDFDYVKIWDRNGVLQYNEEFTDFTNFTKTPYDFICPPVNCSSNFTNFFNQQFTTSYTYQQVVDLYKRQCNIDFESCGGGVGPQLCGDLTPVFPPVTINPLTPCSDSTLFSTGTGTLLYNAYYDSLVNIFNNRYLEKCLAAGPHESFTVTAPISEFHYTLYYYDQAGNLVKTVPPAGVDVSHFASASSYSVTIRADISSGTQLTPSHTRYTQYRYNTLNQVITDSTPDAGVHRFWYDRLGRLSLSQNASQKLSTELNSFYSYTFYDYLGRIAEVGQVRNINGSEPVTHLLVRNPDELSSWFNNRLQYRGQITQTVYDLKYAGFAGSENSTLWQRNLRNRVSYTSVTDTATNSYYTQASFYSYDIHGNVDTLLQDYGSTNGVHNVMNIQLINSNRWKRLVYNYDLISGKVNTVAYQPPRGTTYYPDMFYHRYSYDAENRLTLAETSMDSVTWEKEARYDYYRHGPLARTVTGEQLVQGTDYAYTVQGWLKGVNATSITNPNYDMGNDGKGGNANQYVARDAMGYSLNYFTGAYQPINASVSPFPAVSTNLSTSYWPLYNGNISNMVVNIKFPSPTAVQVPQMYNYHYDQLNRLTSMDAYRNFDTAANSWSSAAITTDYKERISYDANGNILKYLRNGISSVNTNMDSLTYNYYTGNNRLKYVRDQVTDNAYAEDIDNHTNTSNYTYDGIGNLKSDAKDSITLIKWNVYGKITEIQRTASSARPVTNIKYFYDASGNRIGKRVVKNATGNYEWTWYVRDAQGNNMATYFSSGLPSNSPLSSNYSLILTEENIYGSNRLGLINRNVDMKKVFANPVINNFERGNKNYELTNHLGNVLATISDKKVPIVIGNNAVAYNADVVTANDYAPFGSLLVGRKYAASSLRYRYGFNGKENDNEVKGEGNQQDYGMRIYDPRLGRFLSVDPLANKFTMLTPYQYSSNSPIHNIDLEGLEGISYLEQYNDKGVTKIRRVMEATIRIAVLPAVVPSEANPDRVSMGYSQEEYDKLKTTISTKYNSNAGSDENGNQIVYRFNFVAFNPIDKDPKTLAEEVNKSSKVVTNELSPIVDQKTGKSWNVLSATDAVIYQDKTLNIPANTSGSAIAINPTRGTYSDFGFAEVHEISHFLLSLIGYTKRNPHPQDDHTLGGWMRYAKFEPNIETGEITQTIKPSFKMSDAIRNSLKKGIPRIDTESPKVSESDK